MELHTGHFVSLSHTLVWAALGPQVAVGCSWGDGIQRLSQGLQGHMAAPQHQRRGSPPCYCKAQWTASKHSYARIGILSGTPLVCAGSWLLTSNHCRTAHAWQKAADARLCSIFSASSSPACLHTGRQTGTLPPAPAPAPNPEQALVHHHW